MLHDANTRDTGRSIIWGRSELRLIRNSGIPRQSNGGILTRSPAITPSVDHLIVRTKAHLSTCSSVVFDLRCSFILPHIVEAVTSEEIGSMSCYSAQVKLYLRKLRSGFIQLLMDSLAGMPDLFYEHHNARQRKTWA